MLLAVPHARVLRMCHELVLTLPRCPGALPQNKPRGGSNLWLLCGFAWECQVGRAVGASPLSDPSPGGRPNLTTPALVRPHLHLGTRDEAASARSVNASVKFPTK